MTRKRFPIALRQRVNASGLALASAVKSPFMSAAISSAPSASLQLATALALQV